MSHLQKNRTSVAKGSIFDVANERDVKPEEVLMDADVVVMLDQSSSMVSMDGGTQSRHQRAVTSLEQIQRTFPGRIILLTFADYAEIRLNGKPTEPMGSTNMDAALEMAHQFDGLGIKFFLISDGEPNNRDAVIRIAQQYVDPINTIFIGSDFSDRSKDLMNQIASLSGGINSGRIEPEMLGVHIIGMLTEGGAK